jgi:hypothetical protein
VGVGVGSADEKIDLKKGGGGTGKIRTGPKYGRKAFRKYQTLTLIFKPLNVIEICDGLTVSVMSRLILGFKFNYTIEMFSFQLCTFQ